MRSPTARARQDAGLLLGLACLGCALPYTSHAAGGPSLLVPRRALAVQEAASQREARAARRRSWPAFLADTHRNPRLLAEGHLTRAAARRARLEKGRLAPPDSLPKKVLLVRIGFRTNREPSLTSMAANGDFRLQPDTTVTIDPPPHDARFYETELFAMRAYYETMSYGAYTFEDSVFPPQGESSLKLSDPADYGPGKGGLWKIELLEKYFRACVGLADSAAAGKFDLSRFDPLIFVHPGSDLQNDINQDSPNDIPSFYITLADSVPIQGGAHEVRHGIIISESVTQDGAQGGVLGDLCHEFGHWLGLPDEYDTRLGLPAVGEWSLMDSGNALFFAFQRQGSNEAEFASGLLPGGLSAFDRVLLGWESPYVMRAPRDHVSLRPTVSTNAFDDSLPRSAILDVAPDEYFLVENRRDVVADKPGDMGCPYLNRDRDTGIILWMSRADAQLPSRERRNSGEYDYFIASPTAPENAYGDCQALGFGLLVWHVDERVLADGYGENSINTDDRARALRIVEASGDYEIGDWRMPTRSFLGDGWNDPFREGYRTELGATTVPNNWNNDWAQTGWEIENIEFSPQESHRLFVRAVDGVAGWPRALQDPSAKPLRLDPRGALVAEVRGAGRVLVLADSGGVYAFGRAGTWRLHRGRVKPGSLAYVPRLAPGDGAGTLAALDSAGVWLWPAELAGDSLQARPGFPLALPGGAGDRVVLFDGTGIGGLAESATGSWESFMMR